MFRVHCKANFLNTRKNFPDAQKTFRLAMHTRYSGFWDSDPNLLEDNSFAGKMSRNNKSDFFANSSLKRQFGSFGGLNLTCAFTSCERFCATIDFLARNDEPYHHHIEYHSMSAFSQTERWTQVTMTIGFVKSKSVWRSYDNWIRQVQISVKKKIVFQFFFSKSMQKSRFSTSFLYSSFLLSGCPRGSVLLLVWWYMHVRPSSRLPKLYWKYCFPRIVHLLLKFVFKYSSAHPRDIYENQRP